MPHVIESMELVQVLSEAEDISRSVNQKLTSAHQLLAFFTVPNRAELLLRDRGIDEDKVLAAITAAPTEPEGTERDPEIKPVVRNVHRWLRASAPTRWTASTSSSR